MVEENCVSSAMLDLNSGQFRSQADMIEVDSWLAGWLAGGLVACLFDVSLIGWLVS